MSNHSKHPKASLKSRLPGSRRARTALFTTLFALVGLAALLLVHAATNGDVFNFLPQSGTVSGKASVVNDSSAIGGKAVVFGSASSTGTGSSSGSGTGSGTGSGNGGGSGGGSGSGGGGGGSAVTAGCASGSTAAPCIGSATTGASGWGSPVFDDEFTGSSLNTNNWKVITDGGESLENNVTVSPNNVSVSGGNLLLTLSSSSVGANVTSDPNEVGGGHGFQFGNGYFLEGRIYFPGASASNLYNWPAFWTSGHSWPNTGEIDIAEVGNGPLTTTYHQSSCGSGGDGYTCGTATPGGSWGNGWHIYGVDRESNTITVYWDGKAVKTYTNKDGGADEYFLINVGNSTGPQCDCGGPPIYGAASDIKVDYVRAWKK